MVFCTAVLLNFQLIYWYTSFNFFQQQKQTKRSNFKPNSSMKHNMNEIANYVRSYQVYKYKNHNSMVCYHRVLWFFFFSYFLFLLIFLFALKKKIEYEIPTLLYDCIIIPVWRIYNFFFFRMFWWSNRTESVSVF